MLLPKIHELLQQINQMNQSREKFGFKYNQTNIREGLAFLAYSYMTESNLSILTIDDSILNGNYPIPIRIYMPPNAENLPVAIYIHGGGNVCGSITVYDRVVRKLAKMINHIIVAIDYRLSPEFAYPTSLNDSKAVIEKIFPILDEWKINYLSRNLTLIGDSAGGAITASITADRDFVLKNKIKQQVLIYPSLDYTVSTQSTETYGSGYLLEKEKMKWYFEASFQNNEDRKQISPLYQELYTEMPRTLIIVAEYDPLIDEAVLYQQKLTKNGTENKLIQVDGVVHAFFLLEDLCKEECTQAYTQIYNFLQESYSVVL